MRATRQHHNPATSGQFNDAVVASSSNSCGVLLTRVKAARPIDLPLLSPLTLIDYDHALKNGATQTRLTAMKMFPLRLLRRRQCSNVEAASGRARHLTREAVGFQQTPCDPMKKPANSLGEWHYLIHPLSTMQAKL